ncbi:prophage tail fiber N-terminal domain-containing protein [Vibrio sp. E150_018]
MTIQVTGILKDSSGQPSSNTPIQLLTVTGSDGVLPTAFFDTITDTDGNYDFTVNIGIHYLLVRYQNDFEKVGKITVNADTPSPLNLDSLLSFDEPLTPEQILQVQQLVAEAVEAADRAEEAASSVEGIEQAVEEDRQEVADNAAQVAQDAATVQQQRDEVIAANDTVQSNADQVASDTAQVSQDKADVESDRQEVADNTAQVAQDKSDTEAAALLAQMWAAGINPSPDTPSDTNNAKYWSDRAAAFVTGALIYGGQFTPTTGTPYPPSGEVDTMYLVNFVDPETTFTFTSGDLNGVTVKNGNAIIYNVTGQSGSYEASSFVFTGVATVNGKAPDGNNNVDLTASDVGAYSDSETDTLLGEKADADTVYSKGDVTALLQALDDKKIGDIITRSPLTADDFSDCHIRCVGQELLRADYPKVWQMIEDSQSTILDDTTWLAVKASSYNGSVSAFSSGDGSTTFRMIDEGDGGFDKSTGDVTDVSVLQEGFQDQIVNITGGVSAFSGGENTAFFGTGYGVLDSDTELPNLDTVSGNIGGSTRNRNVTLDASRQVNTGSEVQPKGQYRKYFMYIGSSIADFTP